MKIDKEEFLKLIGANIDDHGSHITIVSGGPCPRYAYTIGLTKTFGFELILAGAVCFLEADVYFIINKIREQLKRKNNSDNLSINVGYFGYFRLQKVHSSWSSITMLGVKDFYNIDEVKAYQLLPDKQYHTLDIPDMSKKMDSNEEPVWKWLENKWNYNIPDNITVVTNLDVLRGEAITEVMQWESEEWEMFAGSGSNVEKEEMRVVPMGLLLSIDNSLLPALDLKIGKGMYREGRAGEWNDWG